MGWTVGIAQVIVIETMLVAVADQRSAQTPLSTLTYTAVPSYYRCDSRGAGGGKAARASCFACCRSACVVDEFSQGGKQGGMTAVVCDKACYLYCGYTPTILTGAGSFPTP